MLKKLEELNNYNKFINIKSCNTKWDYNFKHNNIIYARNGYGKTSLSILFESMKNNNSLEQKKFFGTCENILVKFVDDCGKEIIYNKDWINQIKEIEVFNSFYIEDNTYLINIKNNFIEEICDEPNEAIIYKNKIKEEQEKLKKFTIKKKKSKTKYQKKKHFVE